MITLLLHLLRLLPSLCGGHLRAALGLLQLPPVSRSCGITGRFPGLLDAPATLEYQVADGGPVADSQGEKVA
jgi:hypothetical protein